MTTSINKGGVSASIPPGENIVDKSIGNETCNPSTV